MCITGNARTSAHHPRDGGNERATLLWMTPMPSSPRGFPARCAGSTEDIRIVEPSRETASQTRHVAWPVANGASTEITRERTLTGCLGDHNRHTCQWIGERFIRQRELLVWYRHLFGRQPDVETTARIDQNVWVNRLVADQRQLGREAGHEHLQRLDVAGCRNAAYMQLARSTDEAGGCDNIFKSSRGSDGLAEPVHAQRTGGMPVPARRLRWKLERVVHGDRPHTKPCGTGVGNGSAAGGDKGSIARHVAHDDVRQLVHDPARGVVTPFTPVKLLVIKNETTAPPSRGLPH